MIDFVFFCDNLEIVCCLQVVCGNDQSIVDVVFEVD